ncbi:MAG: hypothetical protein HOP33_08640 [Verrucomicrobia bacterium]|nr:hypothetical protein [Verrucomicrobiota bacterium]
MSLVILLAIAQLVFFDVWEGGDWKPPEWHGEPRFVETRLPKLTAPPNASFQQRLTIAYTQFMRRFGKTTYSFGARSNALCSVHGLLTQAMEVGGTKYLIAQEVSNVEFGHTNTLSGAQWVTAFESALQNNQPQCFHPATNGFWSENLLLVRENARVVKVIPRSRLPDYQKAGLVDQSYRPDGDPTPTSQVR